MRTWLRRWRVALHLARRDARRAKGRTILVVAMVGLPILVAAGALTVFRSNYPGDDAFVRQHLGATLQARVDLTSSQISQDVRGQARFEAPVDSPLDSDQAMDLIRSTVPAGDSVVEAVSGYVRTHTAAGQVGQDQLSQVDPAVLASFGQPLRGRWASSAGEVVVRDWTLESMGVAIGDTVTLEWNSEQPVVPVRVVGSIDPRATLPWFGILAAPGTLPAGWAGQDGQTAYYVLGEHPVPWGAAAALNPAGMILTSRDAILNPPPGAPVAPGPYAPTGGDDNSQSAVVGGVVVAVLLLEVVMIIGPAFAVGARRSRRSLALMGATGADPRQLRRIVTANGAYQGALAAVAGIMLGTAIAAVLIVSGTIDAPNLVVPWELMAGLAVLGTLLGAAAAWFPARAASRIDLVGALAGREPSPLSSRGMGWVGLAALGLGGAGLIAGNMMARSTVAIVGAFVALVGVIAASGLIVTTVAKLAPRLGTASRLALRDAVRHRSRTAPALAAVIACAAGATLAFVYIDASQRAEDALWLQSAAPGRILIASRAISAGLGDSHTDLQAAVAAVEAHYPGTELLPVQFAAHTDGDASLVVSVAEDRTRCSKGAKAKNPWLANYCRPDGRSGYSAGPWSMISGERVDDGSVMRALGFPGGEAAAQALEQGKILTHNPLAIDSHGMVTLHVERWVESEQKVEPVSTVSVPGHYVPWIDSAYRLVIPPSVADRLGLDQRSIAGYVGIPNPPVGPQDQRTVAALADDLADVSVDVTVPPERPSPIINVSIVIAALLVAAAATWIAAGLAAADSRADLATMSAVGASPGLRKRFAGAQAGVIAVIGTCVGVLAGMGISLALIAVQNSMPANPFPKIWTMSPPWDVLGLFLIGVPVVAAGLVMAFTRSRMPMVRRLS